MPRVLRRNPAGYHHPSSPSTPPRADPPVGFDDVERYDDDDVTEFVEKCIHNDEELIDNINDTYIGQEGVMLEPADSMETTYSLEAKPTKTTFAETFSSGGDDDQHQNQYENDENGQQEQYSDDDDDQYVIDHTENTFSSEEDGGASFINLAEEAVRQEQLQQQYHQYYDRSATYDPDNYLCSSSKEEATTFSSGDDFINLAQEAAEIPSRHFRMSSTMCGNNFSSHRQYHDNMHENNVLSSYCQEGVEETKYEDDTTAAFLHNQHSLDYADSQEDDPAFSFRTRVGFVDDQDCQFPLYNKMSTYHDLSSHHTRSSGASGLQNNVSLEATSMGYETCSKTLNTNLETLHTDLEGVNYIPTLNEYDVVHDPAFHDVDETFDQKPGSDHGEGESYDDEERIDAFYNNNNNITNSNQHYPLPETGGGGAYDGGVPIPPNRSYLYEDDGFIHYQQDGGEEVDEDETRLTDGLYPEHIRPQDTYQETIATNPDTVTEITRDIASRAEETYDGEYTEVLSQIMDSYLSDHSSTTSWDEGSFASRSRNVSRLDSFDGTEYSDDDDASQTRRSGSRTFVDILKRIRDKVQDAGDDSSDDEEDDEEDDEDNDGKSKKSTKSRRRSSPRRKSAQSEMDVLIDRIGAIGMDLLNETIERSEKPSKTRRRSRGGGKKKGGNIIESVRDIFNCGAPSRY